MKQERLQLYRIDIKYIRNLHRIDDRVSSVSPQIGKQHRIYIGIVVICNENQYLIPLSHPVPKHRKMKPRADFDKIFDKHGKSRCLDFKKLEIECTRYNKLNF